MKELWTLEICERCGEQYFFGDGPSCGCRDEKDRWEEAFTKEFKEDLLGE